MLGINYSIMDFSEWSTFNDIKYFLYMVRCFLKWCLHNVLSGVDKLIVPCEPGLVLFMFVDEYVLFYFKYEIMSIN